MRRRTQGTLVVLIGCMAACYRGNDGGAGGGGDGPGGDGTADDGGSGADDGDGDGTAGEPVDCDAGAYGPRRLRLLTRSEYERTLLDLLGVEPASLTDIPVEPLVDGYDNNADAEVVTDRHVEAYMSIADEVAAQAVAQSLSIGCMPEDPSCPTAFVREIGSRAFRRPLADDEVDYYVAQFDPSVSEGDFYQGVQLAIRALLVSPHFLYRFEIGEPIGDGVFRLTPHETATAISYGLWGTMPDEALRSAADAGELVEPAQIEAQVRRMLADPRARESFDGFATQWLGTGPLLQANKDATIYPAFTPEIREAMAAEQKAFIAHVVFDGEQTMAELLAPGYTFASDALAGYYGLPAPGSSEPVMVEVADGRRGGLLRLGSVIASHAHPNESAPVKRGKFVRERLLCQPLSPPPPNVDATPPAIDPEATTRERFSQHSADPACSPCHQLIDPIGFGFEAYDGVAGFRTVENGKTIDASGEVVNVDGAGTNVAFDGLDELASLLAERSEPGHCAVRQYYQFVAGRRPVPADECAIEDLGAAFDAADGNLLEMIVQQYTNEAFVLRQE